MFASFLQTLAPIFGFTALHPDTNGACSLQLKTKPVTLVFEWDEQIVPHFVLLSTALTPFPIDQRKALYAFTLARNKTLEATLSIHPEKDLIMLHRRLPYNLEPLPLGEVIERFLQEWSLLKEEIEKQLVTPSAPSTLRFHDKA